MTGILRVFLLTGRLSIANPCQYGIACLRPFSSYPSFEGLLFCCVLRNSLMNMSVATTASVAAHWASLLHSPTRLNGKHLISVFRISWKKSADAISYRRFSQSIFFFLLIIIFRLIGFSKGFTVDFNEVEHFLATVIDSRGIYLGYLFE